MNERRYKKILSINANWYSFLSATLLSSGVNFYTGTFGGDNLPVKWIWLVLTALLTITAAIYWGILAWRLDAIQRLAIARRPNFMSEEEALEAIYNPRILKSVWRIFLAAIVLSILGLSVIPVVHLYNWLRIPSQDATISPSVQILSDAPLEKPKRDEKSNQNTLTPEFDNPD